MPGNLEWKPLTLTPVNFSLTDGTQIPAPPDSPPATPQPPTSGPLSSHRAPKHTKTAAENQAQPRPSDVNMPMSPTSPIAKRPGSVRKFWGLRSLSSDSLNSERPGSPATVGSQSGLSRRKSSGWFGRKKANSASVGTVPEGREASQPARQPKSKGPPPPALPELKSLGVNDDALTISTDDMFKNM